MSTRYLNNQWIQGRPGKTKTKTKTYNFLYKKPETDWPKHLKQNLGLSGEYLFLKESVDNFVWNSFPGQDAQNIKIVFWRLSTSSLLYKIAWLSLSKMWHLHELIWKTDHSSKAARYKQVNKPRHFIWSAKKTNLVHSWRPHFSTSALEENQFLFFNVYQRFVTHQSLF